MKKIFFLFVLFTFTNVFSQDAFCSIYLPKKPFIAGGKEGKTYASIIHSKLTKKEMVNKTVDFFKKLRLVDESKKVIEINESISEYSFDIAYPLEFFKETVAISPVIRYPLWLKVRVHCEFHEGGGMLLTFRDFEGKRLTAIVDVYSYKNEEVKKNENYQYVEGERATILMTQTLLYGAFTTVSALSQGENPLEIKAKVEEFYGDTHKRFERYQQAVNDGIMGWLTATETIPYIEKYVLAINGKKRWMELTQRVADEQRVLDLSTKRWEKQLRPELDELSRQIATMCDGYIYEIAEDGDKTWTTLDGKLVPVDSKKLKKK